MLKIYSRNIILRARAFTDRFSLATEERIKNLYENGTQRVGGVCEWGQFVLLPIAVKKKHWLDRRNLFPADTECDFEISPQKER